jgi:hypothetical protein
MAPNSQLGIFNCLRIGVVKYDDNGVEMIKC